ncbi:MAG: HAMP domain-containing sensor histidine kinase [Acetivibrio sp.]
MEIKKKKSTISIFRLFLEHLIGLSMGIIVLILAAAIMGSLAFQSGFVLQANYTEVKLNQIEESLKENFDKDLLPPYCSYILINNTGDFVEGNMGKRDLEKTKSWLGSRKKSYYDFYREIILTNGSILIIKYDMLAHFGNPRLHKVVPYPELIVVPVLLASIVLLAIAAAFTFSKKLKRNLISIVTAAEKIQERDLDFEIEPTEILEFNASLEAIDKLKEALILSLNRQWDNEQQKKSQLSALAHDIKTPLTVIKGNAELLFEEEDSKENKELISYIRTSAHTMEKYVERLMDVVNNQSLSFQRDFISLHDFIREVTADALPLCKTKNIKFNLQNTAKCPSIYVDKELLKRAIINIIDNAVRYSNKNSPIDLTISDNGTQIAFEIKDLGKGFSEESLKKATQELYTEEGSRTNHNYGLGLTFTKKVVELHNGILKIENRTETKGARVSILFVFHPLPLTGKE